MKKFLIAATFVLVFSAGTTSMAAGTLPAVRKAVTSSVTGRHHAEHSRCHFDRNFCGFVDNDGDGFCDNCRWYSDDHGSYCGVPCENNVPMGYGNNAVGAQSTVETPAEPQPVAEEPVDVQTAAESQPAAAEPQPVAEDPMDVQTAAEPQPVAAEPQPVTEAPASAYYEDSTVPQSNGQYYGNGCYGYDSGTNSYGCGNYHSSHHGAGHHGRGHH